MILKDSELIIEYEKVIDTYNQGNIKLSVKLFEELADKGVPEACQFIE